MDSSVSPKDEIWFLHVCHHISNAVYMQHKESTIFICRSQNAEQNHNIKETDKSFENMTKFLYLGTTRSNQNFIYYLMKLLFTNELREIRGMSAAVWFTILCVPLCNLNMWLKLKNHIFTCLNIGIIILQCRSNPYRLQGSSSTTLLVPYI
jgi:hypothetical protein